jgi:hypothetical protein
VVILGRRAGQQVVVSGQFLIDSEASLRGRDGACRQGAPPRIPGQRRGGEIGPDD